MSVAPVPAGPAGLPIVDHAREPEWVRRGSPTTQRTYEAALAFESTLVEQLTHTMAASGGLGEEAGAAEGEQEAATSAQRGELAALLPRALAQGVISAGGLGLAVQLTRSLSERQPGSHVGASGGAGGTT
jgi:hypothetical protein